MAREVTHEASGPLRLDESDLHPEKGDVAVCLCGLSADYPFCDTAGSSSRRRRAARLCGLSADYPFCDGSHRATEDEEPGVVYKYEGDDDENPRRVVEDAVLAEE